MHGLGTSYISSADFLVWGFFVVLIWRLYSAPRNGNLSRALAVLSGFVIVGVIVVLLAVDLNSAAALELGWLALVLALSLLRWSGARTTSRSHPGLKA